MEVSMKLRVKQGDIASIGSPVVAVNLFEGVTTPDGATKALDREVGGIITRALASGDFKGGVGETLILYPEPGRKVPERIVVVGLGNKETFNVETARRVGAALIDTFRRLKVVSACTVLHGGGTGTGTADLARGLAEGLLLGGYRYDNHFRDGRKDPLLLEEVVVVERSKAKIKSIRAGLELGERIGLATNQARELANGPGNEVTPTHLANTAKRLGRDHGFKVKVLGREECEKLGMGAFLGVARGSQEPCKFIVMEYEGSRPKGTVCLVGKGITFDSGGISLKPGQDMDQMKFDMSGAAAVLGAMRFAATQKVPLKVVGLIAATENLPGGNAYKPGDVLESMAGVTIEVLNTDAEGRLVLADALAYAKRYEADAVIDLATLTGACVIALGEHAAGVMSNDEWLLDAVCQASEGSGDRAWPLPLWSEYRDMVKSNVADIKNTAGRAAGAITAGAFLGAFTNDYRWAHLDVAGVAWGKKAGNYLGQGGSGAGVRLLAEFLRTWKAPKGKGPKPGPRTSLRVISADSEPQAKEAAKTTPVKKKTGAKKAAKKKAAKKKAGGRGRR